MSYLSPVAHAISSGEAPKGGKFAEGYGYFLPTATLSYIGLVEVRN